MSRYPSSYGHTPSYRSVASTVYPSALGADMDREFSSRFRELSHSDRGFSPAGLRACSVLPDVDRRFITSGLRALSVLSDIDREFSSISSRSPLTTPGSHSASSSTYKAENYSSATSSTNGGLPHRETHNDSTYRSTR